MVANPSLDMAKEALRRGERDAAREALLELTSAQPTFSEGWLWLAAASVAADDKRTYLRQALELAPHDRRVVAALRALGETVAEPGIPTSAPTSAVAPGASFETGAPAATGGAAAAVAALPASPLAVPHFSATGVQAPRVFPWRLIALVCVLLLLLPLGLMLV